MSQHLDRALEAKRVVGQRVEDERGQRTVGEIGVGEPVRAAVFTGQLDQGVELLIGEAAAGQGFAEYGKSLLGARAVELEDGGGAAADGGVDRREPVCAENVIARRAVRL